jgi:hypothetical protein
MFRTIGSRIFIPLAFTSALVAQTAYSPMTAADRVHWLVNRNISPTAVLEDIAAGAEGTRDKSFKEYGTHWEGFGKRVGMTAANDGVRSVMEAGLGSMWGEDSRYNRTEGGTIGSRLGHVFVMTFCARNRAGVTVPAYARLIANPGGSFLANTWVPDSESSVGDAALRTGMSFLSRMAGNAMKEFRPRR